MSPPLAESALWKSPVASPFLAPTSGTRFLRNDSTIRRAHSNFLCSNHGTNARYRAIERCRRERPLRAEASGRGEGECGDAESGADFSCGSPHRGSAGHADNHFCPR